MREGLVEEVARLHYEYKKAAEAFSVLYRELLETCPHVETVWHEEYRYEDSWGDGTYVCGETVKCCACGKTDNHTAGIKKMPGQKPLDPVGFNLLKSAWEIGGQMLLLEDERAAGAAEADRLFWEEAAKRDIYPPEKQ